MQKNKYKDHKKETRRFGFYGPISIESFINQLNETSEGLVDPMIEFHEDYYFEGSPEELVISGWRPYTPAEIAKRKADNLKAKQAAKRKKEKEREDQVAAIAKMITADPTILNEALSQVEISNG